VLDAHRAKKRPTAVNHKLLTAAANRLRPTTATNQVPMGAPTRNALGGPSTFTFTSRPNALAGPSNSNAAIPPAMNRSNATAGPSNPNAAIPPAMNRPNAAAGPSNVASRIGRNRVVSLPAVSTAIADAARQEGAVPDNDDFQEFFGRKRKRTSQPGPHQISSRTPNTRNVLRRGKEDYAFKIITENAYPTAKERVVSARASHDVALQMAPDAATVATGVQWSPSKVRIYGDMGWVRRSLLKAIASGLVPSFLRLLLPPALAETLPGGANTFNTAQYIRSRVLYLLDKGTWLRGPHRGVSHLDILMALTNR
jgi:hypothetical protein